MTQLIASLTINENEPEALQTYFEIANPLVEKFGGQVLRTLEVGREIVGDKPSEMILLVEYPSRDAVDELFKSDEYKSTIPYRQKAFHVYNICLIDIPSVIVKMEKSEISIPFLFD